MTESTKLWGCGGRFTSMDVDLQQLNNSLKVDKRLFAEDIDGSLAYAEVLKDIKILDEHELALIKQGFEIILKEWTSGTIELRDDDEDVHSVNERRLTELIGDAGRKIHTGRSRNDQVAVDMKLWVKKSVQSIICHLLCLLKVMTGRADEEIHVIMPGYTHLQQAQPVRFSHWLLSHAFFMRSDIERLQQFLGRLDEMPLGSGALCGNALNIDRSKLAELLNFRNVTMNSMYAVSDRDFVVEFNFISTLISTHLSRLAEDLIIYSTKEFNFVKISGGFATGSSLMPNKFNPDSLELVRGLTGGFVGQLTNILVTLKGLPSTYNKDMQNDKQSAFFVHDNILLSLKVVSGVIGSLEVNESRCWNALSYEMLATDLAHYMVNKGATFRDAHHSASKIVDYANKTNRSINKLPLSAMTAVCDKIADDVYDLWSFEKSVEQYQCVGGTSLKSVREQIEFLRDFIEKHSKAVEAESTYNSP